MFHHVLEDANVVSHHEFVHHLEEDLSEAAQIAQKNAIGEQNRHAKIYNRKVRGMPLAVGDRVLLANRGERGKRKVADRWDSTPFDVVSVRSTINVYRIKDVHRNMLLPVDFLTFPDQDGDGDLTSLGESRSNASCVSARTSVALDNQEDSQVRTMDWLMQSPVQAEAESASVPEEDAVGKAVPVDTSEEDQSDELLDSVPDDSIPHHITDALLTHHLTRYTYLLDGSVASGDPPDLVESGQHMAESDKLPPTFGALKQHVLRAHIQARVWGQADIAQQEFLDPLQNGYYKDKDGQLKPVTTEFLPAPEAIIEVRGVNNPTNIVTQFACCTLVSDSETMEEKSPGVSTSGRKPINLSGSTRKLKDNAADWHNFIMKWDRLNDDGYTIANQIVNLRLNKEPAKEVDITVECDEISVPQHTTSTPAAITELEDRCTALLAILEKMAHVVSRMEKLSCSAKGVCELQAFQHEHTGVAAPLFHTWPTTHFDEVSLQLLHSYKRELELKQMIIGEIAHTSSPDLCMVYLSCWLYQPYLEESSKLLLESLLLETGHRPL
ncbi:hypothetical protein AAFF_G00256320 [Aldrovandia affinis]|uniref:Uncharacterized protein n=1 Tax=Aldrovandia affinis TaxID=143900 RepID=A0AAD7RC35_9TELE|nr:hypothetical protein AAFF_G00256320 [Aldrovandia affinis]